MTQKGHSQSSQSSVAARCGTLCEGWFMGKYVAFEVVSESDLMKQVIFSRCKLAENGCWEWQRGTDTNGYGVLQFGKRTSRAHRVSYGLFCGAIPKGLDILHSCDNPCCVNPAHLTPGTKKENAQDRQAKGRGHKLRGELMGNAKLTEEDVRDIRASDLSLEDLAVCYGTDRSNIWNVRVGKSWSHLNEKYPPRDRVGRGVTVRGERVHTAKLTAAQVMAIKADTGSLRQLAKKYEVAQSSIFNIRAEKAWKHVLAAAHKEELE